MSLETKRLAMLRSVKSAPGAASKMIPSDTRESLGGVNAEISIYSQGFRRTKRTCNPRTEIRDSAHPPSVPGARLGCWSWLLSRGSADSPRREH